MSNSDVESPQSPAVSLLLQTAQRLMPNSWGGHLVDNDYKQSNSLFSPDYDKEVHCSENYIYKMHEFHHEAQSYELSLLLDHFVHLHLVHIIFQKNF